MPRCTIKFRSPPVFSAGAERVWPFSTPANSTRMNFPMRSMARIRRPGRCSPSAAGSSMKSVFPSRTATMLRPGRRCAESAHDRFDFR